MFLYLGTLCLSFCYFLYVIAILGNRKLKKPLWATEMVMSCFISPMIVALLAFGIAGILQSLFSEPHHSIVDMAITFAIIAGTAALHYVFNLGKKMTSGQETSANGKVIHADFSDISSGNDNTPSTYSPSDLPKAA